MNDDFSFSNQKSIPPPGKAGAGGIFIQLQTPGMLTEASGLGKL